MEVLEAGFGKESAEFATGLGNMATALVGSDKVRDALPIFESALQIDQGVYGEDDLAVATDHFNLGKGQVSSLISRNTEGTRNDRINRKRARYCHPSRSFHTSNHRLT